MSKILVIDSCWDCKHCDPFRYKSKKHRGELYCKKLKKYMGIRFMTEHNQFSRPGIYKGCKLEDYKGDKKDVV